MLATVATLALIGVGVGLAGWAAFLEARARRRLAALRRMEQRVLNKQLGRPAGHDAADQQTLFDAYVASNDRRQFLSSVRAGHYALLAAQANLAANAVLGPGPDAKHVSSHDIHQAAQDLFGGTHLPYGWNVQRDENGHVSSVLDAAGRHVHVYSRESAASLKSDLLASPHDCAINSEAYEQLGADGTLAKLHDWGVTIYDNGVAHTEVVAHAQHADTALEALTSASEHVAVGDGLSGLLHDSGDIFRAGTVLYREGKAVVEGRKTAGESIVDGAVHGAVAFGGVRSLVWIKSAVVGQALIPVPIVGAVVGAVVGDQVLTSAIDAVKEWLKYGDIKRFLEAVGGEVQQSLASSLTRSRKLQRMIADTIFARQELEVNLQRELESARTYEAELRVYERSGRYAHPTEAGALNRLFIKELRTAVAHVDATASELVRDLVQLAGQDVAPRARLGEIALCLPMIFGGLVDNLPTRLETYRQLMAKYPHHPYRIRVQVRGKEQCIPVGEYFYGHCAEQSKRTAQPPIQPWILPHQSRPGLVAAAGVALIAIGSGVYERAPLLSWVQSMQRDEPAPVVAAGPSADEVARQAADAERQKFESMSSHEHLAAARAALLGGYDRRTRTGGALDLAERHLSAIPSTASDAGRVRRLLAEVMARRRRADRMLAARSTTSTPSMPGTGAATLTAKSLPLRTAPLPKLPPGTQQPVQAPATALLALSPPEVAAIPPSSSAEADDMARARALLHSRHYGEARRVLLGLTTTHADDPELHVGLGECELARGRTNAARDHFNDALTYSPLYGPAMIGIADVYLKQGDRAHALEWYRNYLEDAPNGPASASVREAVAKLVTESPTANEEASSHIGSQGP